MTPELERWYELLRSGQVEVPHDPVASAELLAWARGRLGPTMYFSAWAQGEAMRLQPGLRVRPPMRPTEAVYVEHRDFGCWWGRGWTWREAWQQALLSCWRTIVWQARKEQATARRRGRERAA